MGDREFPFDAEAICEECGARGAFDIYGDIVCGKCLEKLED